MKTIRDYIEEYSSRLHEADNLMPPEASKMRVELCSLLSRVNVQVTQKEVAFKRKKLEYRLAHESAADAKIYSEADPAYSEWLEAKAWQDAIKELIRATRDHAKTLEEEQRVTPTNNL